MKSTEYIVKSWIDNLDVEPYKIDIEYAEWAYETCMFEEDKAQTTPAEIMMLWNNYVDSMN